MGRNAFLLVMFFLVCGKLPAASGIHFLVSAQSTASLGVPFAFTVAAQDSSNNPVPSYSGVVHFASSDPYAILPSGSVLAQGVGTFTATLNTGGNQTITAIDTVNSVSGESPLRFR